MLIGGYNWAGLHCTAFRYGNDVLLCFPLPILLHLDEFHGLLAIGYLERD